MRFSTLKAELLYYTADTQGASHAAQAALRLGSIDLECSARLGYVLSMAAFERGDLAQSLEQIQRSLLLAERSSNRSLIARIQLGLFRVCSESVTGGMHVISNVRKAVANSAEPQLLVDLRLHFARAEASRHSLQEARAHLLSASDLLDRSPNMWLKGRLHLGLSVVDTLSGDPRSAMEQAHMAIDCASESGHRRTELGGRVNLSHALQALGRWGEAAECIQSVMLEHTEDVEIRVAALDCQANLSIAKGFFEQGGQLVADADDLISSLPSPSQSRWADLTIRQTRIRLLQVQGAWLDAEVELASAVKASEEYGDHSWRSRFALLQLRGFIATQNYDAAGRVFAEIELQTPTVDELCQRSAILGIANIATHRTRTGQEQLDRARRIAAGLGNPSRDAEAAELLDAVRRRSPQGPIDNTPPAPDLDSAVALLELGGHPHILAREAIAILNAAGCVRALALVAKAASGLRVVDTHGWNDTEADAAARRPDPYEMIPVGVHRDEPWLLLVDARPELEHRCTLIAVRKLIGTALTLDRYRREEKQRAALWPAEALDGDPDSVWASAEMTEILTVARRIAPTPLPVLLTGETGTGKEVLARAIHRASNRADRPLVPFNCTAVPHDMLESQLFGYRKGAFTGADASFPGVIRSAAGGTLFLDEIAEVGLDLQPKLLRFLESSEIHPLGEPHPMKVDVRVIAATNARLEQLVAEGRLREDLFYRLNVVRLKLPPLRERREEIPPLVDHYLRKYGDELKKGRPTLSDEALEYLLLYNWPGNLRQLANELRRMVAMADAGAALTPAMLSAEIQASRRTIPATPATDPEIRVRMDQPLPVAVELLEQTMVRNALDRSQGKVEEAARLLGISRKGLFLKRRRWGLRQAS
jgi:DNA-binding NtrC family response regulator/tetratricopeptide (TPR) repeat protein